MSPIPFLHWKQYGIIPTNINSYLIRRRFHWLLIQCTNLIFFMLICSKTYKINILRDIVLLRTITQEKYITAGRLSKYGVFSGPYFALFGLNTEIYGVKLRIQSEHRKRRTRKNSILGHFSGSVRCWVYMIVEI